MSDSSGLTGQTDRRRTVPAGRLRSPVLTGVLTIALILGPGLAGTARAGPQSSAGPPGRAASETGPVKPPMIDGVRPGVPCVLTTRGTPGTSWHRGGGDAGRCAGGKATDDAFRVFTLPADRPIDIDFTEPMDEASLTLTSRCPDGHGIDGSVLVARIDKATGRCQRIVPGTLDKSPRHVRFVPNTPWQPGTRYVFRLRTAAEGATRCDKDQVCGSRGQPLNPDPLAGTGRGGASHPFVIPFDAVAPTHDTWDGPASLRPFTDRNGNGRVDPGERPQPRNVILSSAGNCINKKAYIGMVNLCPIRLHGRIYLSGTLPVVVGAADGRGDYPVTVLPGALYGTNLDILATRHGIHARTGMLILRIRPVRVQRGADGHAGRLVAGLDPRGSIRPAKNPATGGRNWRMHLRIEIYLDAPDEHLPLGGSTDLHSKPVGPIDLAGPVQLRHGSPIVMTLRNQAPVRIPVSTSVGNGRADTTITIARGHLRLRFTGRGPGPAGRGLPAQ